MAQYRKRPVVIEAEQYSALVGPLPAGVKRDPVSGKCYVETLEGPLNVQDGDWIITGVQGEKYPCKPAIFEATYEPVEDIREFLADSLGKKA